VGSDIVILPETRERSVKSCKLTLVNNVIDVHLNRVIPSHSVQAIPRPSVEVSVTNWNPFITVVIVVFPRTKSTSGSSTDIFVNFIFWYLVIDTIFRMKSIHSSRHPLGSYTAGEVIAGSGPSEDVGVIVAGVKKN
jgi:hypothetical protein